MVYTETEKQQLDGILQAFKEFIDERDYFDIIYSEKMGYLLIRTDRYELDPVQELNTAREMIDVLFYEVTTGIVFSPEYRCVVDGAYRLSPEGEAESRRQLKAIVEKIAEGREGYLEYIDEYLKYYKECYK